MSWKRVGLVFDVCYKCFQPIALDLEGELICCEHKKRGTFNGGYKKDIWSKLKPLGFRKRRGLKHDYEKYLKDGRRIHIQNKNGFKWHIDNH